MSCFCMPAMNSVSVKGFPHPSAAPLYHKESGRSHLERLKLWYLCCTWVLLDSWGHAGLILQCLGAVQAQWEQALQQVLRASS